MFHLSAFYASVAASQTNSLLPAVQDGAFTISNQRLLLPQSMRVDRAFLFGLGVTEGRINVPSLRAISLPRVYPVDKNAAPTNDPFVVNMRQRGCKLLQTEGIGFEASTDATAGPNGTFGLLWMYPSFQGPMTGDVITCKATATVVSSAGVWTAGSITLEQDLPSGTYQMIGADAWGTNVAAVRFRFPGQFLMPGILAQQAAGEFVGDNQRFGQMGPFGSFTNTQVPTIEVLGTGATSAITLYIDLIKIG